MQKNLLLTLKWGTRYGPELVNRLAEAAHKHTTTPLQIICFTDDPTGLNTNLIEARPLPAFPNVPEPFASKPWRKLSLWQKNLGGDLTGRPALVLDIDLIVMSDLTPFFTFEPTKPFAVWRNPTKPHSGVGNTSAFRFVVGAHPEVFDHYIANPLGVYENDFKIEQEYISAILGDGTATKATARTATAKQNPLYQGKNAQVFWPEGWVLSFKEDLLLPWPRRLFQVTPPPPPTCKVIAFHGKPDPEEAAAGIWPTKKGQKWKKIYKSLRPIPWLQG